MKSKSLYVAVGLFLIVAFASLVILAFQMTDFSSTHTGKTYRVTAAFTNIGNLKMRSPVRIAGVTIGRVSDIELNKKTFQAEVTIRISGDVDHIPSDSSASILTAGLLGANYISITPGYEVTNLASGDAIETTHSALILEKLIGKLIYKKTSKESS